MSLPPLLLQLIRDTQIQAIRDRGFVPDPDQYAYASATLWQEIIEKNAASASPSVRADLQDTMQLMRQLGPFQNPMHLFALVGYNRQVLQSARRMGIADDSWVPFASATVGTVNAVTIPVRGHYAIIFNDGLFRLVQLLSHQLSYAFSRFVGGGHPGETFGEACQRAFREDSEIVRSFVATIVSYATTGDPRSAEKQVPQHLLREDGVYLLLRDTALRFVVAHELGHVYLRHSENVAVGDGAPRVAAFSSWGEEYAADKLAADIAVEMAAKGQLHGHPMIQLLAVEFQPVVQVLISSAKDYLNHGQIPRREEGSGTHPPSDRRFAYVRESINAAARQTRVFDQADIESAQGLLDFVLWALLPPLRDACLQLRSSGVRAL